MDLKVKEMIYGSACLEDYGSESLGHYLWICKFMRLFMDLKV